MHEGEFNTLRFSIMESKEKNPNPTTTITPLQQTLLKAYRLLGFKKFEN
jgi:hypothetical protein